MRFFSYELLKWKYNTIFDVKNIWYSNHVNTCIYTSSTFHSLFLSNSKYQFFLVVHNRVFVTVIQKAYFLLHTFSKSTDDRIITWSSSASKRCILRMYFEPLDVDAYNSLQYRQMEILFSWDLFRKWHLIIHPVGEIWNEWKLLMNGQKSTWHIKMKKIGCL